MNISDAARAMSAQRKTFAGGRPKKLSPCPKCGRVLGARDLRAHRPLCGGKPAHRLKPSQN